MKPRWRKVFADLWNNKMRSALVIASIAVGLFALGIITSLYTIIRDDMSVGYSAKSPANIQIFVAAADDNMVDLVRDLPGVKEAEGRRVMTLRYKNVNGQWDRLQVQAIPDIDDMRINQVSLLEGEWPPAYREIAVDTFHREDLPAGMGGAVDIQLPSGKIRQLTLTGVVNDQTIGSASGGGGYFLSPLNGYISLHTLDWLEQPALYNVLMITVSRNENDHDHIRDVASKIVDEIEAKGGVVTSTVVRASVEHPNSMYVDAISGTLFMLGFLVVFLSGFLITNTLSSLLNQQIRQIGVMKTIGATRWQIIIIYMVLIAFYGLFALLIAIPTANAAAFGLAQLLSGTLNFDVLGFRQIPSTILIQSLIALLVPQFAGFFPIFNGAAIKTVEAISGGRGATSEISDDWFSRQINRIKGLPHPLLISLRNTFRHKGRLALTLFTLTLGGAIFIATFNVQGALQLYIKQVSKYFIADVSLTMDKFYRVEDVVADLGNIPGIENIEGWTFARCEVVLDNGEIGESVEMLGVSPVSKQIVPILIKGRWIIPGDHNAIVLSERFLSEYPDLDVGDTLTLRVNGANSDWIVVGFFQLAGKSSGFRAYANYDYLSHLIGSPGKAISFQISADQPDMTIAQQREFGEAIELEMRTRGYSVSNVSAGLFALSSSTDGINVLVTFLVFMAFLTALVGAIGLMGTMSMNVMDRTREIGIMRAIGATDRTIIRLVIVEGLIIGLISWMLGSLLSFPISNALSDIISQAIFDAPSILSYSPEGFIIWFGLVAALATLASVLPARNAAHLTIREVLSYE